MDALDARSDQRSQRVPVSAAAVFAAMSDPSRVARWWGPDGFTCTVHEFECHPDGRWRMTLHGPDGADYPNEYRVMRLERHRLLELDHPSDDHHFVLRLELTPQNDGTLVEWRQTFDSAEEYLALAGFLAQANEQVLARLAKEACRDPDAS